MDKDIKIILRKLEHHESRIAALENDSISTSVGRRGKNKTASSRSLKHSVQLLWKEGFFNTGRIDTDVVSELQKRLLTSKRPRRSSVVNVMRGMVREYKLVRLEVEFDKKKVFAYKTNS